MLQAIESYFYPANDCSATDGLHSFIAILSTNFVNRVHLERYNTKLASPTPGLVLKIKKSQPFFALIYLI